MAIKYLQLAATLRTDIGEGVYRASGRLPTEMQLAERYGVSRQTVRQALAVLCSEGLIEKRQGSGSHIREGAAKAAGNNIAIIATFVDDYIFPPLLHNVQSVLEKSNYATLVYSTQNQLSREREILQTLLEHPVRGLLVEGVKTALPNPNLDLYQRLQRMGIPIVFFHGGYPELDAVCISDDNEGGGYQAVQYLLGKGHTRIGGIFKSDDIQGQQRYFGFLSALRDRNFPFPDQDILWYSTEDRRMLMELGQKDWLERYVQMACRHCTAIVCYNDEIAYSLIQVLLNAGYRVPEEIAVCSFDNSYYSEMGTIPITSLAHNPGRIGHLVASSLIDLMRGKPARSHQVDWHLVEKKST